MKSVVFYSVILSYASLLTAQAILPPFARVYVGKDNLAHVVDRAGKDVAMAQQVDQVGVDVPLLSADYTIAGWEINEDNCCTSYSIPTRVALYAGDRVRIIADGMMVYDWCFVPGSDQVAVSTGTVHGSSGLSFKLYNARTGQRMHSWIGTDKMKQPAWARCLK